MPSLLGVQMISPDRMYKYGSVAYAGMKELRGKEFSRMGGLGRQMTAVREKCSHKKETVKCIILEDEEIRKKM